MKLKNSSCVVCSFLAQAKVQTKEEIAAAAAAAAAAAMAAEEASMLASVTVTTAPFEAAALAAAVAALTRLAAAAAALKLSAPAGGWKSWQSRLARLLNGDIDPAWAADSDAAAADGAAAAAGSGESTAVVAQLCLRMQEIEHVLVSATGEWTLLQKIAADAAAAAAAGTDGSAEDSDGSGEESDGGRDRQHKRVSLIVRRHTHTNTHARRLYSYPLT